MALWGEGNVSARLGDGRFLVKASGTRMHALQAGHLVEVRSAPLLDAIAGGGVLDDAAMDRLLLDVRADADALKPSVESLFHAWLLELPGIRFVGHCHPIAVNQILCSPRAEAFARQRLFPDHVVYTGPASALVPYVDPGLVLARTIAREVLAFTETYRQLPRTILLQNHGLIALGASAEETMAAVDLMEKAARVFIGAAALGGPVFLPPEHVRRIAGRPDEHYRKRMLTGT
ncbi:MAG: class II aldolase [Bacteroidetes bacterium]|nr:MAG: class II aldolase [Bacteroidota bacterium]